MIRAWGRVLGLAVLALALSCSERTEVAGAGVSVELPLPAATTTSGPAQQVVVISVDGLRPDAMSSAPARHLMSLIRRGTHCPEAETIAFSETLPAHASMFTGLDGSRHGVNWNDSRPGTLPHPSMFTAAAEAGLSTAMLFAKDKFHYFAKPGTVHWIYGPRRGEGWAVSAADLAQAFSKTWPNRLYHLTFVHLGEPDWAGHGSGWMSPQYLEAVRRADEAIGVILETIRASGRGEKTAVIVTADHGGRDKMHHPKGSRRLEDVTIPWICVGPGVKAGAALDGTVRVFDTAPTALALLGVKPPPGIDGQVVKELFK